MWSRFVFCLIFASLSYAVDRSNFKTCEQSAFCRRYRSLKVSSDFHIDESSINSSSNHIEFTIVNVNTKVPFAVSLEAFKASMARLYIKEVAPLRKRFEAPVGDVIVGELEKQGVSLLKNDLGYSLTFDDNKFKVDITSQPFSMSFSLSEQPLVVLNEAGLLHFEHYRAKAPSNEESPAEESTSTTTEKPVEEEEKKEEKQDEDELWEETFKSHTDTKPHGPSAVGVDVTFPGFSHVFGIPEHADTFSLRDTTDTDPYRLYNLDVFEYELETTMALYGSVPYMLAHNTNNTVGVFWNNPSETWIDIKKENIQKSLVSRVLGSVWPGDASIPAVQTRWVSESGNIDLYIMLGSSPAQVFKQFSLLTGGTPLPPLFAISYHQCRWNYNDEEDVHSVDAGFDEHDIPYDVLWLDIEHTDGKRYFTWDNSRFPHPEDMLKNLAVKGRKMVNIVDPHLKRDDNYHVFSDAKSKGLLVKDKDLSDYEGWCWPGSSSWPDFLQPDVRSWWADRFLPENYPGSLPSLFIWNDMNEPSVFSGPEITMQKDFLHANGEIEHREIHNLYGAYVLRATFEGLLRRDPNARPFVLSRAFYAGSQRYGAIWTGDNTGEWSHLAASIPMLLSLSVSGISFCGADVGGFFKNPDPELLVRWYQAGAFQPFFRAHAHLDTKRREPWLFEADYMNAIRDAIRNRYALLPYWYTLFYENEISGMPPMRPLWVEFPTDSDTYDMQTLYMIGSALLMMPVTEAGVTSTRVYLPGVNERWFFLKDYSEFPSGSSDIPVTLSTIPVFQRGGTIVPRRMRIRRSSSLTWTDPITLIVCLDNKVSASGTFYMDDYHSYAYRKKSYLYLRFTFINGVLTSTKLSPISSFSSPVFLERVVFVGLEKQKQAVLHTQESGLQSLGTTYNNGVLTVRKPGIFMNDDSWRIVLTD